MAIFCGCDFIEPRIEAIQSGTNGPCSSECVHVREYILFIHIFLGCDTTSHILGQGKSKLLKVPPAKWAIEAAAFYKVDANKKDIIKAGETILLNLIKSSCGSLDEAREQAFHSKATTNMVGLKCSTLPPTSAAFVLQ